MRNPGVAAVLSFVIPGLGQIYNGRFVAAIMWFIATPFVWVLTLFMLGWVCHVVSALTAYRYAVANPIPGKSS